MYMKHLASKYHYTGYMYMYIQTWVQVLQNLLKYKYKYFKICHVQGQATYFLKYLTPAQVPVLTCTFKHMNPLTQFY